MCGRRRRAECSTRATHDAVPAGPERCRYPCASAQQRLNHAIPADVGDARAVVSRQEFDPWGSIRSGGISQTTLNYTGQRRDGTGLLYYHARYYDPALSRFISADSVVPGALDGSMGGVALKPLTVDFHETGFVSGLNAENGQGFWFQNADQVAPWGPANPQGLNRYSYVQNIPCGIPIRRGTNRKKRRRMNSLRVDAYLQVVQEEEALSIFHIMLDLMRCYIRSIRLQDRSVATPYMIVTVFS
jgi:RHS repeat-associated protein